jgi:ABC-type transport system involved in multi-copper enzyme maturation permease subunit
MKSSKSWIAITLSLLALGACDKREAVFVDLNRAETLLALLNPQVRSLGPVFLAQLEGALLGSPLPLGQSVLLTWPQLTGMLAGLLLLFAASYVLFQRQEVRA